MFCDTNTRLLRIRVLLSASLFAIGSLASPAHHFLSFADPESLKLWKLYLIETISLDPLQRAVRSTPVKASIPNCSLQYFACRLSSVSPNPEGKEQVLLSSLLLLYHACTAPIRSGCLLHIDGTRFRGCHPSHSSPFTFTTIEAAGWLNIYAFATCGIPPARMG